MTPETLQTAHHADSLHDLRTVKLRGQESKSRYMMAGLDCLDIL